MSGFVEFRNRYMPNVWKICMNVLNGEFFDFDEAVFKDLGRQVLFHDVENVAIQLTQAKSIGGVSYSVELNGDDIVVYVQYRGTTLKLCGTINLNKMIEYVSPKRIPVKRLEAEVRSRLEGLGLKTFDVCRRDGLTIFAVEDGKKRLLVWIRNAPITSIALDMFEKKISKYQHDGVLIIRLAVAPEAEYVKNIVYRIVYTTRTEEIVKTIAEEFKST